jgi:hypothetical protein
MLLFRQIVPPFQIVSFREVCPAAVAFPLGDVVGSILSPQLKVAIAHRPARVIEEVPSD